MVRVTNGKNRMHVLLRKSKNASSKLKSALKHAKSAVHDVHHTPQYILDRLRKNPVTNLLAENLGLGNMETFATKGKNLETVPVVGRFMPALYDMYEEALAPEIHATREEVEAVQDALRKGGDIRPFLKKSFEATLDYAGPEAKTTFDEIHNLITGGQKAWNVLKRVNDVKNRGLETLKHVNEDVAMDMLKDHMGQSLLDVESYKKLGNKGLQYVMEEADVNKTGLYALAAQDSLNEIPALEREFAQKDTLELKTADGSYRYHHDGSNPYQIVLDDENKFHYTGHPRSNNGRPLSYVPMSIGTLHSNMDLVGQNGVVHTGAPQIYQYSTSMESPANRNFI